MWRLWCYALGRKEGREKREADAIAGITRGLRSGSVQTNQLEGIGAVVELTHDLQDSRNLCYNMEVTNGDG